MNTNIIEHFSSLQDPRIERKKPHALMDHRVSDLRNYQRCGRLDCIAYVISRLSVKGFQECFMSWTQTVMEKVVSR